MKTKMQNLNYLTVQGYKYRRGLDVTSEQGSDVESYENVVFFDEDSGESDGEKETWEVRYFVRPKNPKLPAEIRLQDGNAFHFWPGMGWQPNADNS